MRSKGRRRGREAARGEEEWRLGIDGERVRESSGKEKVRVQGKEREKREREKRKEKEGKRKRRQGGRGLKRKGKGPSCEVGGHDCKKRKEGEGGCKMQGGGKENCRGETRGNPRVWRLGGLWARVGLLYRISKHLFFLQINFGN